jgi:cytochrome c oxidase subunit 2
MSSFLPPAASSHAGDIDFVLLLVHGLMFALFAGWSVYFVWVLFRFRSGRSAKADPHGAKDRLALGVEIGIVVAEVILLVGFALPLWFNRTTAAPADPQAVVIRVVAEQFNWNVLYPGADGKFGDTSVTRMSDTNPFGLDRKSPGGKDDIVELNVIHLPINHPVIIQLSSKDVIHSFGVPAMRVKQDTIPGTISSVWFTPTMLGQFDVQCSQLCGLGHYRMKAIITVESEVAFRRFLAAEATGQGGH